MKISPFHYKAVALALGAAAVLAACGDDTYTPPDYNTLPARITNVVGPTTLRRRHRRPADRGPRQDRHRRRRARFRRSGESHGQPSCAAARSTPTTAASSTSPPRAATARCTAPTSTSTATTRSAKARSPARKSSRTPTTAPARRTSRLMVQIPASFDKNNPCIVTGPSSGSRGVYGAIGTAGDWGLKHGCAVAYTDAGKGTGYQDLAADKVNLIDGRLVSRASAGTLAQLRVRSHGRRADRLQRRVPQPHRVQARVLAAESRKGLGPERARQRALRVLGAERAIRRHRLDGQAPAHAARRTTRSSSRRRSPTAAANRCRRSSRIPKG